MPKEEHEILAVLKDIRRILDERLPAPSHAAPPFYNWHGSEPKASTSRS